MSSRPNTPFNSFGCACTTSENNRIFHGLRQFLVGTAALHGSFYEKVLEIYTVLYCIKFSSDPLLMKLTHYFPLIRREVETLKNLKEIGNRENNINKKYYTLPTSLAYKNGFFAYHAEQPCQSKSVEMLRLLNDIFDFIS